MHLLTYTLYQSEWFRFIVIRISRVAFFPPSILSWRLSPGIVFSLQYVPQRHMSPGTAMPCTRTCPSIAWMLHKRHSQVLSFPISPDRLQTHRSISCVNT